AHGLVRVVGGVATYRATEPLYAGADNFGYRLVKDGANSNEAVVSVAVTPVASGTFNFVEDYANSKFSLSPWRSYSSSYGHTSSSVVGFGSVLFGGSMYTSRHFGIYGDIDSYAGDATYN